MAAEPHPSAARIIDLYRRHAADWIERRGGGGSPFEQPWLDRFRALMPEQPSVLDLGCGSGKPIADYLITQGATVAGVDASGPLLDFARTQHPAPHAWIEADIRTLDLGRTFDGVIAWHSLIHLSPEDHRAMFAVFARHVRPGGALIFTSGDQHGEVIGEWQGEPLYHGSLSPAEYLQGLGAAGFDLHAHMLDDPNCGNATIWLARKRDATSR